MEYQVKAVIDEYGKATFEAETLEEVSQKWNQLRERLCREIGGSFGDSSILQLAVYSKGKKIANLTWNGKVEPITRKALVAQ